MISICELLKIIIFVSHTYDLYYMELNVFDIVSVFLTNIVRILLKDIQ